MKNFKHLITDVMPCWYELSWKNDPVNPAIIVRIHKDFIEETPILPASAPVPARLMTAFGFKSFCGDFGENFGFEEAFQKQPDEDDFTVFSVKLPKIKKDELVKCSSCGGTGFGFLNFDGDDGKCFTCKGKGSGKEHKIYWHDAHAVSASFTVFTFLTFYNKIETSAKIPQLLTVKIETMKGMQICPIRGIYSIPLTNWLRTLSDQSIDEVTKAMIDAYNYMFGVSEYDRGYFWNQIEDRSGWLNINCAGDECFLYTTGSDTPIAGRGYEFCDYNTDSPLQQLTLLAGLAALHDKARKEIG